ncbi:MAG: succinate dehydrogenase cytochrome b subunit [Desulfobacterales bacterium]|jgi:succinate dehydrogenase / fumarate reductase cytochrome b subunit|nr:succinate dehydrogenase cytochrome b subunit [Desulfobacterales bacterium]
MNWFIDTISTSIGKKLLMAVTGLGFCMFLLIHMIGNLTLYGGKDLFMAYVEHLHALSPLILAAEIGLVFFACVHVATGLILFLENRRARPVGYAVKKNAGGRTFGSATMPYTGFIILCFLILHLINFRFIEQTPDAIFQAVSGTLSDVSFKIIYIAAVFVVALHVRHGFWSLFQTLGANHLKYMPMIQAIGIAFALLALAGFGLIPIVIGFIA